MSMIFGIVGLNSPQRYRPALNAGLILTSALAFRNISDANLGIHGTDTIAMFILFYISHMTCALCMENYVLPKGTGSFQWRTAYRMLFNARFIATYREVPDESSTYPSTDVRALLRSPRFLFLRKRALSLLAIYALDQCYSYLYDIVLPQYIEPIDIYDMLPSRQTYFRRLSTVTLRETTIHFITSLPFSSSAWGLIPPQIGPPCTAPLPKRPPYAASGGSSGTG
ncbi:hypothetical protein D0Z07_9227 [Hyphodiscus hymeniophilus]|uniref:Wax synthase domain-containing protein n=1 Tax=Hyphodiscus hymeniophilus TaxID=353542 RepID=A0A9P6SKD4_9HELO|nr:hypothetical protein D0Z07_9227 [Hyphodiscus hymeniophilus]